MEACDRAALLIADEVQSVSAAADARSMLRRPPQPHLISVGKALTAV
jgi:hypothetical protein